MTDEDRIKHVTEIMNLIEAYRRGQDVESWRAVMHKLFDVIGIDGGEVFDDDHPTAQQVHIPGLDQTEWAGDTLPGAVIR